MESALVLVSVIIPTHNRAELLPRAIRSVLGQTYLNLECIVVDDASTDNTRQVIQHFNDERLVYLRHEINRYASAARNTGIACARGELIAFLDDDDEWLPTKLEKQVALIQNLPARVGMVYCWMDYFDTQEHLVNEHHPTHIGHVFPLVLGQQRIGGCPTLLVRRSVVKQVGGFDEELPRGNDGDFILRVCHDYDVDFVPEVLVKVYVDHAYERISQFDEQGIRNAIKGHQAILSKFHDELHKYPKQVANRYAIVAYYYSQLGCWQDSLKFYWQAVKTFPFSFRIYRHILRTLKVAIVRAKPA